MTGTTVYQRTGPRFDTFLFGLGSRSSGSEVCSARTRGARSPAQPAWPQSRLYVSRRKRTMRRRRRSCFSTAARSSPSRQPVWSLRPCCPGRSKRNLRHPADAPVGRISYSLYLWHLPVFVWVAVHVDAPGAVKMVIAVALSFAISTAAYFVVRAASSAQPSACPRRRAPAQLRARLRARTLIDPYEPRPARVVGGQAQLARRIGCHLATG